MKYSIFRRDAFTGQESLMEVYSIGLKSLLFVRIAEIQETLPKFVELIVRSPDGRQVFEDE